MPADPDDILADNPPLADWPEVRALVRAAVLAEREACGKVLYAWLPRVLAERIIVVFRAGPAP